MANCPFCGVLLGPGMAANCPRCHSPLPAPAAGARVMPTRLEAKVELAPSQAVESAAPPPAAEPPVDRTPKWRPTVRPPMALLVVLDDGSTKGETIRLRESELIVGRTKGGLLIPHDDAISGSHFRITRSTTGGVPRWTLHDLDSRNGTFVRVDGCLLQHRLDLILGQSRFRFELAQQADSAPEDRDGGTRMLAAPGAAPSPPVLVRCGTHEAEARLPLPRPSCWVGSDAKLADVVVPDDPALSPRHAQFVRQDSGVWRVVDGQSRNGTWVAIHEVPLGASAEILAGEQRFLFRVLP